MIRINLLDISKPKGKRGGASAPSELSVGGGSLFMKVAAVVILAGLVNAGYWYRQAGQPVAKDSLEAEWERIVSALLGSGKA